MLRHWDAMARVVEIDTLSFSHQSQHLLQLILYRSSSGITVKQYPLLARGDTQSLGGYLGKHVRRAAGIEDVVGIPVFPDANDKQPLAWVNLCFIAPS